MQRLLLLHTSCIGKNFPLFFQVSGRLSLQSNRSIGNQQERSRFSEAYGEKENLEFPIEKDLKEGKLVLVLDQSIFSFPEEWKGFLSISKSSMVDEKVILLSVLNLNPVYE